MNLKDQVLSVAQVQELQELGFDISKYATLYWASCDRCSNEKCFERQILELNISKSKCCVNQTNIIPTLTIGDIIDILPEKIYNHYSLEISKNNVEYCDGYISINVEVEEKLIDAFFKTLKWCIKQKHIALSRSGRQT